MNSIRTTVQDGRIDISVAADLPEGTEVEVRIRPLLVQTELNAEIWDDTPEGIEAWIKAANALEPLLLTPEERAAWDSAVAERKQWEKEHFFQRADRIASDLV